jgi:hypothetical protein
MATLTGDREGSIRSVDRSRGGLSGWFSGTSAPIPLGIDEDATMEAVDNITTMPRPGKLQKRPTMPQNESPPNNNNNRSSVVSTASTSRFNFFSSRSIPKTQSLPADLDDELLNFDIPSALFPGGAPSDKDPFSPAAFKNLLQNAEGLLTKLQTAYKIRTLSLHEITAEKEAQAEELEEAETRAQCLKQQLEDLAKRVQDQDAAVAELVGQAAVEKAERREERDRMLQEIRALKEERLAEEDLGVDDANRRRSHLSTSSCSSDDESAESVFSRARSTTSISETSDPGTPSQTPTPTKASSRGMMVGKQERFGGPLSAKTKLQLVIDVNPELAEEGCANCRGGEAGLAWDAVGLLRAENRGLKERVEGLEKAVEGVLDLVR